MIIFLGYLWQERQKFAFDWIGPACVRTNSFPGKPSCCSLGRRFHSFYASANCMRKDRNLDRPDGGSSSRYGSEAGSTVGRDLR
jgi:hypothetical protein